jgi:hypothetical protein
MPEVSGKLQTQKTETAVQDTITRLMFDLVDLRLQASQQSGGEKAKTEAIIKNEEMNLQFFLGQQALLTNQATRMAAKLSAGAAALSAASALLMLILRLMGR